MNSGLKASGQGTEGRGKHVDSFTQLLDQIADAQVPESAVTQHEAALSLIFAQLQDSIADGQVPESAVTQHEAALSILFSQMLGQIADGQVPESAVTQHNAALDHGPLQGLSDDDHLQYLLLAGRAGGQFAFGGTAPSEELELRGTTDANLGQIRVFSPIDVEDISAAAALNPHAFRYAPTQNFSSTFVGGGINISPTIGFSAPTFIWEAVRGGPIIQSNVAPGFAAFTLFNSLPVLTAGAGGTFNPLGALVLNAGVVIENDFTGSRTATVSTVVNAGPQTRAGLSGGTMNVTAQYGMQFRPTFSTVLGSSVNLGTIRAVLAATPSVALFQPQAGTEAMTAYYGLDVEDIAFGGAVEKAGVRSNIPVAVDAWFLLNIGGAWSDFGAGDIHFDDNALIRFGGTAQNPDAVMFWDGVDLVLDPHFGGPSAAKVVIPQGGVRVEAEVFPVSDFIRRASSTNLLLSSWRLSGITSGDMADGFGTALFWSIEDDAGLRNNIAFFSAERAGADNSGLYRLRVYTAGVASQIYEASRLTFTVTVRSKVQGANALVPISPAQITTDEDDYQGQGSGTAMRGLLRLSTDASRTITGIDATTVDFSEADDELRLVNIGAFDLILGHQDVGSAAANRIISPTGADLVLGPDEMALLWYDGATSRWRILETTGA